MKYIFLSIKLAERFWEKVKNVKDESPNGYDMKFWKIVLTTTK